MKTYTISAQTLFSAVKHQWKLFLAIVLIFTFLGCFGGLLFADRGSSEIGGGGAVPLPQVDFETVAYTPAYYNDCLSIIIDSSKKLNLYLNVDFFVKSLPEEQAKPLLDRLTALNKKTRVFQQTVLVPLQNVLEESGAFYVPEEFLNDITTQYENALTSIEFKLIAAKAATETVRQMGIPNYDYGNDDDRNSIVIDEYTNLFIQAADYGNLLKSQAVIKEALRLLRDEPERIRSESNRVEQALNNAAAELNKLLEETSQIAKDVGMAADVSFSIQLNDKSTFFHPVPYKLVTNHTYRAVSLTESFAAIELFFILVGICAGAFFAVCREAKSEKRDAEKSS